MKPLPLLWFDDIEPVGVVAPSTRMTTLSLDFETSSEAQLRGAKSVGLYNYMIHPSTKALMLAWSWNDGDVEQVDFTQGGHLPPEVKDGLLDPNVIKFAFNASFERLATKFLLKVPTPVQGWRCSMVLAFMRSFTGGLAEVGSQLGMDARKLKDPIGEKLIKMFSMPQRITKNQPFVWRDHYTDPDDWDQFLAYNRQDVVSETEIKLKLLRYPIRPEEWRLYEIDQIINDRGMPVDRQFIINAAMMATRRKTELMDLMREVTSVDNPNSTAQFLPWMRAQGYPFADLQKNTVKKVLEENKVADPPFLTDAGVVALKLRQQASRTSVKKYDAIERRLAPDDRLRHVFQFAGAARTNRWAGRGPQPQNLVRTPKALEGEHGGKPKLEIATDAIRFDRYDDLRIVVDEPMVALAGCIRSSFRAPAGYEFVVCDLSAIESAVIAWLSGCRRMLRVFKNGLDPYRDFGTELYSKPYDAITKEERNICKPPTLGCGFGLGGGKMVEGKRTGLWGYAESMGVDISVEESHRQVKLFRDVYPEIPAFWKALEDGAQTALKGKEAVIGGKLKLVRRGPYVTMELPSGRLMFYYRPKMETREFEREVKTGRIIRFPGTGIEVKETQVEKYTRRVFTHMGISVASKKWQRIISGGPKLCENAVQATAREVLAAGMRRAHDYGFKLVGHVHDELITQVKKGSNIYTLEVLKQCMVADIPWAFGLPLKAAGYVSELYKKD